MCGSTLKCLPSGYVISVSNATEIKVQLPEAAVSCLFMFLFTWDLYIRFATKLPKYSLELCTVLSQDL